MNQETREIKRTCFVCKKRAVWVRQIYKRHIADWEDGEIPICDICQREEEKEYEKVKKMERARAIDGQSKTKNGRNADGDRWK